MDLPRHTLSASPERQAHAADIQDRNGTGPLLRASHHRYVSQRDTLTNRLKANSTVIRFSYFSSDDRNLML